MQGLIGLQGTQGRIGERGAIGPVGPAGPVGEPGELCYRCFNRITITPSIQLIPVQRFLINIQWPHVISHYIN